MKSKFDGVKFAFIPSFKDGDALLLASSDMRPLVRAFEHLLAHGSIDLNQQPDFESLLGHRVQLVIVNEMARIQLSTEHAELHIMAQITQQMVTAALVAIGEMERFSRPCHNYLDLNDSDTIIFSKNEYSLDELSRFGNR